MAEITNVECPDRLVMALFSKKNLEKANKKFRNLEFCLDACDDFLIMGDPEDELITLAESAGYQVITVQLHSINPDLRGTPVIGNVSGIPCFNYHVPWADPIFEHPDKKFLVVFYIEEADPRAINALKSIIEAHDIQGHRADNFFVGVICRDSSKEIQSTILPLLTRIDWVD